MEMLFNKLKKEGLLTNDDIKKMKNKLSAGIDDVNSIIIKLEKLNSNSMKYSVKDKEYYKSLVVVFLKNGVINIVFLIQKIVYSSI